MATDKEMVGILDKLTNNQNPRIQEKDFVRYFLPIFSQRGNIENPVSINQWLTQTGGNAFVPVDVCRGEEVLYQVPPMLNSDDFVLSGLARSSVYEAITTAQLKYSVMPKMGDLHMKSYLTDRIRLKKMTLATINQWNSIFKRYSLPLLDIPEDIDTSSVKPEELPSAKKEIPFNEFEEL